VVGEFRAGSGYLKGYLDRKHLPDSLALLPVPPRDGSAEAAADLAIHRATRALRDTPRWALAAADDNLKFPKAAEVFSCALAMPISQAATPHLNMLLRRTLLDAGLSTYAAKDSYKRQRPFAALNEGTCAPASEATLRNDGSYPSGHAALGWAWGLVLTAIAPDRADALLQRAHAFGQSRVVCGVHWQSDVDAGRLMGAATVARLQSDPAFQAQAALAKQEIAAARSRGTGVPLNCDAEMTALGR
jgi:acid phosphatase (class A)